jgi:hypothetical protein
MAVRSLLSRVWRALARLLRRITIALGALILVFHFFGDWIVARWPYPACQEWPRSSVLNARGDGAELSVRGCIFGFLAREHRVRVRLADSPSAKLIVRFKPKDRPALQSRRRTQPLKRTMPALRHWPGLQERPPCSPAGIDRMLARRFRARLTRLFNVPMAQPQMTDASS